MSVKKHNSSNSPPLPSRLVTHPSPHTNATLWQETPLTDSKTLFDGKYFLSNSRFLPVLAMEQTTRQNNQDGICAGSLQRTFQLTPLLPTGTIQDAHKKQPSCHSLVQRQKSHTRACQS